MVRIVNSTDGGNENMRDGILSQLPPTLSKDQVVFVIGNDTRMGVNYVKSLIQELNRDGEWIRSEFHKNKTVASLPDKTAVALLMGGITEGSIVNIRKSAKSLGVPCIPQVRSDEHT